MVQLHFPGITAARLWHCFRPSHTPQPTVFFHIPKCAGTAFSDALREALHASFVVSGVDWSCFGGFDKFDTIAPENRKTVYGPQDILPEAAEFVTGHFALSTTRRYYPNAKFCTLLRESDSRLLSHWLYWRQFTDEDLVAWGQWSEHFKRARGSFMDFLRDPLLAAQIDNIAVRMLLWPDKRISANDFIDPKLDDALVEEAVARLSEFEFVDYVEDPNFSENVEDWLGRPFVMSRLNATRRTNASFPVNIDQELRPDLMTLLEERGRLDNRLWRKIVGRRRAILR